MKAIRKITNLQKSAGAPLREAADIPGGLDVFLNAAVQELRNAIVGAGAAEPTRHGAVSAPDDADLAADDLIEISTAMARFNRPADSLRWMCREQGCGVKRGGRWLCSPARIERWLNGT